MTQADQNIYEQERRQKLEKLRALGVDPFGQRTEGLVPLAEAKAQYKPEHGHDAGPVVKVAGRVMFAKRFGKLAFMTLRDDSGDLQVALDKKRLPELDFAVQELIDLGDQIVVEGPLGTTKTGEVTVRAKSVTFAAKALVTPPGKFHGLEDVELRYRQRYVDLWANPEVMRLAKLRIRVIEEIRAYLRGLGYLEVETPMMQLLHGGAAARPFVTHHNALDIPLYMRIAPELFLKRLLVGGMPKVFEINRNFRNEGISPRHNPEFTMLEAYEAYGSWETMADMVEGLICHVAEKVFGGLQIVHRGSAEGAEARVIHLKRPWRRVRMTELVEQEIGWKFKKTPPSVDELRLILDALQMRTVRLLAQQARETNPNLSAKLSALESIGAFKKEKESIRKFIALELDDLNRRFDHLKLRLESSEEEDLDEEVRRLGKSLDALGSLQDDYLRLVDKKSTEAVENAFLHKFMTLSPAEQLQEVYEKLVEPSLIDPTFVTHVPSVIIPLAKENREDPYFADVYELAINGVEISPGYTELNDPDVQAKHFAHQVGDKEEQQKMDEDFLNALRHGMPPAGGMGLGVDRLLMMLTGADSIRDVILFPLMKPQGG